MQKHGGSYEVIDGKPVAIDEKRRAELMAQGGKPRKPKVSRKESDENAPKEPAGDSGATVTHANEGL